MLTLLIVPLVFRFKSLPPLPRLDLDGGGRKQRLRAMKRQKWPFSVMRCKFFVSFNLSYRGKLSHGDCHLKAGGLAWHLR